MPYKVNGRSNYPNALYLKPQQTADKDWLQSLIGMQKIPAARVESIESINAVNTFYPMEVIATDAEVSKLIHNNAGKSYFVYPRRPAAFH